MNVVHTLLQQLSSHGTQDAHAQPLRSNPRQLLRKIFAYLDFSTLRSIYSVSRVCREVAGDPQLWATFNLWCEMPFDGHKLSAILASVFLALLHVIVVGLTMFAAQVFAPAITKIG